MPNTSQERRRISNTSKNKGECACQVLSRTTSQVGSFKELDSSYSVRMSSTFQERPPVHSKEGDKDAVVMTPSFHMTPSSQEVKKDRRTTS